MPLELKPSSPLPPFTFSPEPPSPATDNPPPPPRPPADLMPEKDMHMFGSHPLDSKEEGKGLVRCTRCGRVNLESAAAEHKRICAHILDGTPLTSKKTKPVETKKRRASEAVSAESNSPSKKRTKLPDSIPERDVPLSISTKGMKKSEIKKMQKEMQKAEKKAAKEQERLAIAERKRQRATNPLDLDRQCGVINDKGLPCSRSLTCKTHTVGAKRAVEGRTRPYDILHLEWQRANNPNFKEPATKKEKDAKRAENKQTKTTVQQKKKPMGGEYDEDDLDSEDAQRELNELISIAKMAGQRVSQGRLGAWWGISGIGMGGVGRVGGVWRAATWEFAQVGEMFTKALAVRKPPIQADRPISKPQQQGAVPPPKIKQKGEGQSTGISIPNGANGDTAGGIGNPTFNPTGVNGTDGGNNGLTGMNAMNGINLNAMNPSTTAGANGANGAGGIGMNGMNGQLQSQLMAMQGMAGRMNQQIPMELMGQQQYPIQV